MRGRVFSKSSAAELVRNFDAARPSGGGGGDDLDGMGPSYNGTPGRDYPLIVAEFDMPGRVFILARWGLVPSWVRDPRGGHKPINAKSETVATNGMFRAAYRSRRALMPVHGYFEWQAIRGSKVKQPFAIAMKDGAPFCLAAIWETWRNPETTLEERTFAVVTCPANEMMAQIHDRMPVIIAPEDYERWLGQDPDPRDLLKPYPSELMTMWPISTQVNSPANNAEDLLDPLG